MSQVFSKAGFQELRISWLVLLASVVGAMNGAATQDLRLLRVCGYPDE